MHPVKNYAKAPRGFADTLRGYLDLGWVPGGFVMAVLENDLTQAIARADDQSARILPDLVRWLYNEAPAPSWGSPAKVRAWLARDVRPCALCAYEFDHEALGPNGCPDCHGEGLDEDDGTVAFDPREHGCIP